MIHQRHRKHGKTSKGAHLLHELEKKNQHLNKLYEQVTKAKADWQGTFDAISDMICILDNDGRITRVNRSFHTRLKKSYESIIGFPCYSVMHDSPSMPDECPLNAVLKTKQAIQGEADIQIGDSLFAVTIYPFFDPAGEMQGTIHIYRDTTEQKRLKDKLIQSEKMAAIGTLAAEIAHEINNPLDYIGNYLYLFSETLPPDFPQRCYLEKIETGINNLTALTRDLLEFSRPRKSDFTPLDLQGLIDRSLEFSNGHLLRGKKSEIVRDYRCSDCVVMGSDLMLQQVLLNLLHNALDAMPGGGGKITISTSCSQGKFILEFADTGIGIPEEHLTRIFEPFFTTKKTVEKRGTGLGLTICYNIINRHNGEIQVSSKVGEGTKFIITLPLHEKDNK